MKEIKVLVFDFDGTLVNSNTIKHDAYFYLFPNTEKIRKIVRKNISRKPRWDVIEDILNALQKDDLLKPEDLKKEVERLTQKYGEIVEKAMINSSGIHGSFVELWNLKKNYEIYINSGTPTEPLKRIIRELTARKKIPKLTGVLGRENGDETTSKVKNLEKIMKIENITKKEMVMIGDGIFDKQAANLFGCKFIHISKFLKGGMANDQKG
ncbi:HAD family hydrolase [Patescibacteria group bacterium]|nr:HAD family hydrolase [Patescibacteria group bacterium]